MSRKFTTRCGCATPHAVTKEQRIYAKRALQVAYSTRDGAAIAKIKDALQPCKTDKVFERVAVMTLINAMSKKQRG